MYPLWGHAKSGMLVYALYISVRIVFDERGLLSNTLFGEGVATEVRTGEGR